MKISANENRIFWEDIFADAETDSKTESWLIEWKNLISQKLNSRVLDIGCGSGEDTKFFISQGLKVSSLDFSKNALTRIISKNKNVIPVLADLNESFPFKKNRFEIINASLSLHYFDFEKTKSIISEISESLVPKGLFFGRFNSGNDFNHGAEGKSNLKLNNIRPDKLEKRFFEKNDLLELFNEWKIIHLEEKEILYFGKEKVLWEIVVEKSNCSVL